MGGYIATSVVYGNYAGGGAVRWLASLVVVGQFVLAALFYFRWSRRWSLLIGQASYFVMYVIVLWSIELQHSGVL